MEDTSSAAREWIIQRCTQRWINTQLLYEDCPRITRPTAISCGSEDLMTREEVLQALEFCNKHWPDDEFRGHNVINCQCSEHVALKAILRAQAFQHRWSSAPNS